MATPKNRYIVFQIINSNNKPIRMTENSFLGILKDRIYQKYGLMGLTRFDNFYVTIFIENKQIVVFKVPRICKEQTINALKQFIAIQGHKIRFESLIALSSIIRVKKYLKQKLSTKNENISSAHS